MNLGNLGRIAIAPHRLGMTRRPAPMAPIVTGHGPLLGRSRGLGGLGRSTGLGLPGGAAGSPAPVLRYWRGGEVPGLKEGGTLGQLKRTVASDPHGDTVLAQISPDEARQLHDEGGADVRNPRTGLRQFYINSGGPNGSMQGGIGSNSTPGSHAGSSGSGPGSGRSGTAGSAHQAAISQASMATPAPAPAAASRPIGEAPAGNATVADYNVEQKYINTPAEGVPTDRAYWNAVSNLGPRMNDYMNRGNTVMDNIGNKLLGLASIGELDPTRQPLGASVDNPNANWGIDPLGVATTAAGLATGLPIGTLYKGAKTATGWEGPMISFGGPGTQYQNQFSNGPVSPQIGNEPVGYTGPSSTASAGNFGPGAGQATTTLGQLYAASPQPVAGTVSTGQGGTGGTPPSTTGTGGTGGTVVTTPNGDRVVIPFTGNPLTYGQGGEWAFFNPEGLPTPQPVNAADGGTIKGEGDGQEDKIPALLSDGEHVIDAQTVAAFGRGSNDAGHKVIEQMKAAVRKKAGYKNPNKAPIMKSIGSLARAA